jgi:hypothetical protein
MVWIKGGHILKRDEMFYYNKIDGYRPITDEYCLAAKNEEEFPFVKIPFNHSCNANSGLRGEITGVAMRNIKKDEEITFDYAFIDNEDNIFDCTCGEPNCRKKITGYDWKIKELQDKYFDYFASYLKEKILSMRLDEK